MSDYIDDTRNGYARLMVLHTCR